MYVVRSLWLLLEDARQETDTFYFTLQQPQDKLNSPPPLLYRFTRKAIVLYFCHGAIRCGDREFNDDLRGGDSWD